MLKTIVKKIGRMFIILTDEGKDISSWGIKEVLLISLPPEEHLNKAVPAVRERFKRAELTVVLPEPKLSITGGIVLNSRNLREMERRRFDVVVILSLDPYIVIKVFRAFNCPKLLYNYCGEWYLLRRRTIREMLEGKKGADSAGQRTGSLNAVPRLLRLAFYLISGYILLLFRRSLYRKGRRITY
jgi:hypothetical protein